MATFNMSPRATRRRLWNRDWSVERLLLRRRAPDRRRLRTKTRGEGAKVAVVDISGKDAERVAAKIRESGGEAMSLVADVT